MRYGWYFYSRVVQKWLRVTAFHGMTLDQTVYQMQQLQFEMERRYEDGTPVQDIAA